VFALEEGGVSEPLPVKDGAVLLHVSEVTEGMEIGLEDGRERIRGLLQALALDEEIALRVRDLRPPEGSTVLAVEDLETILQGNDPEREVLVVGEFRVTVREMARFARSSPPPDDLDPRDDSEGARRKRLAAVYRRLLDQALLYGTLVRDQSALTAEARREAEEQIERLRERLLVDEEIRRRVGELIDSDPERLKKFYEDNAHHFQSPPRFRLRQLTVPAGEDPVARMAALERLRERLIAGQIDLDAAASQMGGEVEDLGWKDFDKLRDVPAKARTYLLELGGVGFTIPYPNGDGLQLLEVEEREEPRPLSFDEARERVRGEYLRRNQRALSEQVTEEILAGAGFRFDEEALRTYLSRPS
jgi:parvulin-like peptidyl-prolyl isomerase